MSSFTDQLGRRLFIPSVPRRIVSLVPSQTELLHHLHLEDFVAGITKFCIHPKAWHRSKTRVGGTKNVNLEKVHSLQPDLVIANKEENIREQVEALALLFPTYVSDVDNLGSAVSMIRDIGEITGTGRCAGELALDIIAGFSSFTATPEPTTAAYLIWREPFMAAGGGTFINHMLERTGLVNVFADTPRYPAITVEMLSAAAPAVILLSTEPYPFRQKHCAELQPLFPHSKIVLVDGTMFSWYGSRLAQAAGYLRRLRQQLAL